MGLRHRNIRWLKAAILAGLLIQFVPYPPARPGTSSKLKLGPTLDSAFRNSCFDCHAREKPLPWYGHVAPMSWWIGKETSRALDALDFSRWDDYTDRQRQLFLERSLTRVQRGTMPPLPYHFAHPSFSVPEQKALEAYLARQPRTLDRLRWSELSAWPAEPWNHQPVSQVVTTGNLRLESELILAGGILICEGDLVASAGVSGHGGILVKGKLTLSGLQGELKSIVIYAGEEALLQSESRCQLHGFVYSPAGVQTRGVVVTRQPGLVLPLPGVRQTVAYFCRDDGQLGEFDERCIVLRYREGRYTLWDPERETVRTAGSPSQAFDSVAEMLSQDPVTKLSRWRERYASAWEDTILRLAENGAFASFNPEAPIPPQAPAAALTP